MRESPDRMRKRYKNFSIEAQPLLLPASGVWGVRFRICGAAGEKSFTYPETYENRTLTVYRCFELAERIIDTLDGFPFRGAPVE